MQTHPCRRSIRIPDYDYSQPGAYFITLCAEKRRCVFGDVVDFEVRLNAAGSAVSQCWRHVLQLFPFAFVTEWVLMPNHLHAILSFEERGRPAILGRVVGAFKTASTNRLRRDSLLAQDDRLWQRSYYERVIRTESGLQKMRQYIIDNPVKWALDPDNPTNWAP